MRSSGSPVSAQNSSVGPPGATVEPTERIHYAETRYGFEYGAAKVERLHSDKCKGWVIIGIDTPRHNLQIYVTKTGRVRVYDGQKELGHA
jgi:hypothetical protein